MTNSLACKVLIKYFFIFRVSKQCTGIVVFCIRDYVSRIQIHYILMFFFFLTSDFTDESRKNEISLQLKIKKHYIKTWKISYIFLYMIMLTRFSERISCPMRYTDCIPLHTYIYIHIYMNIYFTLIMSIQYTRLYFIACIVV